MIMDLNLRCSSLFVLFLCFCVCKSAEPCPKDHWYDRVSDKCKPCDVCKTKSIITIACTQFSNTMCVDPSVFTFVKKLPASDTKVVAVVQSAPSDLTASPIGSRYDLLDVAVVIVLCVALAAVLAAVVLMILKRPNRLTTQNDNGKRTRRFRLFSRDRLSTTEYMKDLATLDRRLAMDEILEKRKKAIFEPQLLSQNVYMDDVFVDMSGSLRPYEEMLQDDQENRKGLLNSQDQQRQQHQ